MGLTLLKEYLDKCTILIEDFDINPNVSFGNHIGLLYKLL
jgi:hypothetical protein